MGDPDADLDALLEEQAALQAKIEDADAWNLQVGLPSTQDDEASVDETFCMRRQRRKLDPCTSLGVAGEEEAVTHVVVRAVLFLLREGARILLVWLVPSGTQGPCSSGLQDCGGSSLSRHTNTHPHTPDERQVSTRAKSNPPLLLSEPPPNPMCPQSAHPRQRCTTPFSRFF